MFTPHDIELIDFTQLNQGRINSIETGLVYFCEYGRNAWHSTWIQRYTPGSIHYDLNSAKIYCENRRTRGSKFYIREMPCLIVRTPKFCILTIEINCNTPLQNYSIDAAIADPFRYETSFIRFPQNRYLQIGRPLIGYGISVSTVGRFMKDFRNRTRVENILLMKCKDHNAIIQKIPMRQLYSYKSESYGTDYYLSWNASINPIQSICIKRLKKIAINVT